MKSKFSMKSGFTFVSNHFHLRNHFIYKFFSNYLNLEIHTQKLNLFMRRNKCWSKNFPQIENISEKKVTVNRIKAIKIVGNRWKCAWQKNISQFSGTVNGKNKCIMTRTHFPVFHWNRSKEAQTEKIAR